MKLSKKQKKGVAFLKKCVYFLINQYHRQSLGPKLQLWWKTDNLGHLKDVHGSKSDSVVSIIRKMPSDQMDYVAVQFSGYNPQAQSFQSKPWFLSNTWFYIIIVKTQTLELDVLRNQICM